VTDDFQVSGQDLALLENLLGAAATAKLVQMHNNILAKMPMQGQVLDLTIMTDRAKRGEVHQVSLPKERSLTCD